MTTHKHKIDINLFNQYLGENNAHDNITDKLNIASLNPEINKAHQQLYSYLIKHITFMETNMLIYGGSANYNFIWSKYNTIINPLYNFKKIINKKAEEEKYTYPENNDKLNIILTDRYNRTIYDNVRYILQILGKFNKEKTIQIYDDINDYINIFDGDTDLINNFNIVLHNVYLTKYKNEIELLNLCKTEILPYIMCGDNYDNCERLQQDISRVISKLSTSSKTTALNLYDLCSDSFAIPFA